MAKLTPEQYEKRRNNAVKRNIDNQDIATSNGMTEEQSELISDLCSLRHDIHSNPPIVSDDSGYKQKLIELNIQIKESGLNPMEFVPHSDHSDFIDIDTIDELYTMGLFSADNKDKWYDKEYLRIAGELEQLNEQIEDYLRSIDRIYGTNYSPSGFQRL